MRVHRSRKGLVFTLILLVIYVVSAISALIALNFLLIAKLPDENIGEYQGALLSAYERANQKLFYLERSAKISLEESLVLLNEDQRKFFLGEGDGAVHLECGSYVYQLWNDDVSCLIGSREERLQVILDALKPRIQQRLGEMTLRYPGGNFNVPYQLSAREEGAKLSVHFGVTEEQYLVEPIIVNFDVQETARAVKVIEDVFSGKTMTSALNYPSSSNIVTSCFGLRQGVDGASGNDHMGIDLPKGEVYAAKDGTVINQPPGTTGTVWLEHNDGLSTRYMHLDPASITLNKGDFVKQGQRIGIAKSTGCYRSSGAPCGEHLHFEVLVRSIPGSASVGVYSPSATPGWFAVNPMCFFSEEVVASLEKYNTGSSCDLQRNWRDEFCEGYGFEAFDEGGSVLEEPKSGPEPLVSESTNTKGLSVGQQENFRLTQQRLTPEIRDLIREAASTHSVDEALILGVITQESLGDPDAISPTSCAGIMQFCVPTAKNTPGLAGHVTPCQCTRKGAGCFCNRGNDHRLLPEYAIPAGGWLLRQNLNAFDDQTDQMEFAIAAYNGGPGVVRAAIRELGNDPSWSDVSRHLLENPQLLTYGGDMVAKQKKMKEITHYVDQVVAYTAAWNGGEVIDGSRSRSIVQVRSQFGDVKKIGEYTYDPSMTIALPNELSGYLGTVAWASSTIEECRTSAVPQECLQSNMKDATISTVCEEDVVLQYLVDLYQSMRNCQDNKQTNCQCQLPHPPSVDGSYQMVFDLTEESGIIREEGRVDGLYLDGIANVFMQQEEGFFTTELIEYAPRILTLSYKDGVVSLWFEDTDGEIHPWTSEWLLEADFGLVFKKKKEAETLCAPMRQHYAMCTDKIKFAITLKDDVLPVVEVSYDSASKQVVLVPTSDDIAFYNVYVDGTGVLDSPELQVRGSFDASAYGGKSLRVVPVDLVGNEGEGVSIQVS